MVAQVPIYASKFAIHFHLERGQDLTLIVSGPFLLLFTAHLLGGWLTPTFCYRFSC